MSNKVLIVDDAMISREILKSIISKYEFEVYEAKDGKEAITKAVNINPDVIFMDINMPNLDGISATKEILKRIDCKIIMCSGDGTHNNVVNSKCAGAIDFICKPVNKERIIDSITSHFKIYC